MKIQKLFLPLLVLAMFFSGTFVQAQSKSEKEQEQKIRELEKKLEQALQMQEIELQEALEQSKKINSEDLQKILEKNNQIQYKVRHNYLKSRELNKDEYVDQMEDHGNIGWRSYNKAMNNYKVVNPPDVELFFDENNKSIMGVGGAFVTSSRNRTALTIQKELEDVTFDTKFKYEVTEGSNGLNFRVSGSMEEGTLLIKLNKPGGEVLQEIEISPLADINWNQDLRWAEEGEKKGNIGSWIIEVSAKGATGHYHVSVRAN